MTFAHESEIKLELIKAETHLCLIALDTFIFAFTC